MSGICCFSLLLGIFALAFSAESPNNRRHSVTQNDQNKFSGVRLSVVSQRPRPEDKPNKQGVAGSDYTELVRNDLLVRFRLANNGEQRVYYLAGLNSIEPVGYTLFRKGGEQNWKATSPARGREGSFTGGGTQWLLLPPCTAVEFETLDLSTRGEEHAISIFLNYQPSHEGRIEFVSDLYSPMKY